MLHLFPHKFQYMNFIIKILLIHNIYHGVLTLIRHLSSALVFQNSRPHPRYYLSHPYPCCFLYILVILEQNLDSYHYKKSAHLKIKYPYQISLPIFMFLPSPLPLLFLLLFSPPHFFFLRSIPGPWPAQWMFYHWAGFSPFFVCWCLFVCANLDPKVHTLYLTDRTQNPFFLFQKKSTFLISVCTFL